MKAVLKYPGSKWRIAQNIISMIPNHHSYLEPYFGSGAVFFTKDPSAIETINDLDNDIPNLFKCIRNDPERLRQIYLQYHTADMSMNLLSHVDQMMIMTGQWYF